MKPKLFISRRIPEAGITRLNEVFEVKVNPHDRQLTQAELLSEVGDIQALLCLLSDKVDKELIEAAPQLKVISSYAVGYNNIDVDFATSRGIAVCNTAGVLTESTADLTWALIMAACRRLPESEAFLRSGKFVAWEPMLMLGQDVYGKTLGIVGMGRIGKAVAKRSMGFDMQIIYTSSGRDEPTSFPAKKVDLPSLLKQADIISLHAPLTPATHHLIGKAELATMKRTAVLINTARGAIVDEAELINALAERRIFAAGLDVFEHEPDIPEALLALPNAVLLPHIGSASIATRTRMSLMAAENAIAVMMRKQPPSQVNKLP